MSKSQSDIENWIESSKPSDSEEEEDTESTNTNNWETARNDWPSFLQSSRRTLLSSSTKVRSTFLLEQLRPLARTPDLSKNEALNLFALLTLTYPRYIDRPSRDSVLKVLSELCSGKHGVSEFITGWIRDEARRGSERNGMLASASYFVLLSWSCCAYRTLVKTLTDFETCDSWLAAVEAMSLLLDLVLDEKTDTRQPVQRAAVVLCRRTLRFFPSAIPQVLTACLRLSKANPTPPRFAPLIGLACDVKCRLKDTPKDLTRISDSTKTEILQLYSTSILMSRNHVSPHVPRSLDGFISMEVKDDDLRISIIPVMEKASLRSPEAALPVMAEFFKAYSQPVSEEVVRRMTTVMMNCAKSANSTTRSNAVSLCKVLLNGNGNESHDKHVLNEIIGPLRTNKSTGAENRIALYSMLAFISPSEAVSQVIADDTPILLVKESSDAAQTILSKNAAPHFIFLLKNDKHISKEAISTFAKELNNTKISLRRATAALIGSILWGLRGSASVAGEAFIDDILPSLDSCLKTSAANPLGHPAGPLEGYVAIACMLGPISQFSKFEFIVSKNASIQSLSGSRQKPTFLLSDKVYQRLNTTEEQEWLLRALLASYSYLKNDLQKHDFMRLQTGLAFIHIATNSVDLEIRRSAISTLEGENKTNPSLVNQVIREAIYAYIGKLYKSTSSDVDHETDRKYARLVPILSVCATFGDSCDAHEKEALLAELMLVAHHAKLTGGSRQLWIELCQRGQVDPKQLIINHAPRLTQLAVSESQTLDFISSEDIRQTVKTMAFVAPEVILPKLVDQIKSDVDPIVMSSVTSNDIAIWETPEGTPYIDVLASQNKQASSKGKDAAIEKWEAELRSSLAAKKPTKTPQSLSKQEKLLVDAQLRKESEIRHRVEQIRRNILRGFNLIQGLVDAGTPELTDYFSSLLVILLDGVVKLNPRLLGVAASEIYSYMARYTSPRLTESQVWVAVATVRLSNAEILPEEMRTEPLYDLILRVAYRLRSLSEQSPFDCQTFSYISPLTSLIVRSDLSNTAIEEEGDALELVMLCIDVMKFHGAEFADVRYPRVQTIADLLFIIKKHPPLGKEAVTALVTVAEAIRSNTTEEEISVLIEATMSKEAYVRNASLQCLQVLDLTGLEWSPELWISRYDSDQQNARIAQHIWEDNGLDVSESFFSDLRAFLDHENPYVRSSCALSLADAVAQWPQTIESIITSLQDYYRVKTKDDGPQIDEYGVILTRSVEKADLWPVRLAIAQAFETLASVLTDDMVKAFMITLVEESVLGDAHSDVRSGMLRAATQVIDMHGQQHISILTSMFEKYLSTSTASTSTADYVKEAVIILLGRTARHMDVGDERIPGVVSRLIESLKTPSEQVQIAVSECIAPLVEFVRSSVDKIADDLLKQLFHAEKYGERRGAAYGLAGIVKGAGIASINDLNILERIRSALEDKKRYEPRQGAMFLLETLSATLGRNFEPYIIELLPSLLASFGDPSPDVREATEDAAKVIMANLSGFGLKRILPSLLSALEEKQWRTKKGSIELLGTMAYCSPHQLSVSLPTVIPRLTGVLMDSHAQVRTAANRSLKQFGEVINNPEIQSLIPVLLKALADPTKTSNAMTSILRKSFVHYIDTPSLALLIPIIDRGLRERGSELKKKAAQIVGNLTSLTDSQDFLPYLTRLLPLVHGVLVDPVPEARATAAKTLGTLVERLGEEQFPDMVPGLLRTLKADTSGVDRQGAAQGLSEVLAGLGMERLEALLPDIVSNAQSPRSTVREGFMSLLVYLPATFGVRFQPHLTKIVGPILSGLSDSEEHVRDAAMRAGRMIINNYSSRAIDLLLPELERGMFDPNWRIRHSSITLIGELLFKVAGVSGKAEIEEEGENVGVSAVDISRKALVDALGKERRERVLSALYIVRQDAASIVRQSAIHIWKVLVQNTPKTVRELIPELVNQLIYLLVDKLGDAQDTASRTMGELCRKLGERIIGEMVPVLRMGSNSTDSRTREGVCLALCEIMENATETQRESHDDDIVAIVRTSLVDDDADVRGAAAQAFDCLQEHLGGRAIDQTIPTLLEALRQPGESSGTALQALKEVMSVRANSVFPVLIPTLLSPPITVFNARALATLVTVAGSALSKRLIQVLNALVGTYESNKDEELADALAEAFRALLGSIADQDGLNTLMTLLQGWTKTGSPVRRATACKLFGIFCEESDLDDSMYRVDWIRQLVTLLDDPEVVVHAAAWQTLDVFVKSIPKDEMEPLAVSLRRAIEATGAPGHTVPGFNLPKGVSPMVPIIIAGLTTGSNDQRENAAYAIGELVTRTEESAIKPFVVPFTGPLIRVAAQSTTYPPGVKSAIMISLTTMLERIAVHVKPFFPQLQRTFVKAVGDPSSAGVRGRAATALGVLMRLQPRVDPIVTELVAGARGEDEAIAASHVTALAYVVKSGGNNMSDKSREACIELIEDAFKENHDEVYSQAIGQLFTETSRFVDLVRPIVKTYLVGGTPPSMQASHAILAVLEKTRSEDESANYENIFQQMDVVRNVTQKISESISSDRPSIYRPAQEAKELLNA